MLPVALLCLDRRASMVRDCSPGIGRSRLLGASTTLQAGIWRFRVGNQMLISAAMH
jgi:hypothetical protein